MSAQLIVRCPSCSQKYRVNATSVGRNARCKVCQVSFVIGEKTPLDDDTIISWITQDAPASASVMGATGIFHEPPPSEALPPEPVPIAETPSVVRPPAAGCVVTLVRVDEDGAHFEFPASALGGDDLRNSFPRRCVGCGAKHGLTLHLIYWPERMAAEERSHWREHQDAGVAKLEAHRNAAPKALLAALPVSRHVARPFKLPFPVCACSHCHVSREVRGHVTTREGGDVCELTITSLSIALDFYANNGGQDSTEYNYLVQERERTRDAWRDLGEDIRQRLSQWFEARAGERFVQFFRDAESSPMEAGASGALLTSRRLIYRKYAAQRDYSLDAPCRIEIKPKGVDVSVHILEEGGRPAMLILKISDVDDLAAALRTLGCRWGIAR